MELSIENLTNIFDGIYKENAWSHRSGPGSIAEINKPLISFLEHFILRNQISSICDFGCGDWQYMKFVHLGKASYVGYDVAESVLKANRKSYGRSSVRFEKTPSDLSTLSEADLFISKDTFMHLPNGYVSSVLNEARRKSKLLLLITNDPGLASINQEIEPGQFRHIDLRANPFCLSPIDLFQYSSQFVPNPAYPAFVSVLMKKYVWPGRKTVQLLIGDRFS